VIGGRDALEQIFVAEFENLSFRPAADSPDE
jgi:hypothetical protein